MPRSIVISAACVVLLAGFAGLWLVGGPDGLSAWAMDGQRRFQNAMATGLRALEAGDPGALMALMGLCFAYGFFHAAGPGHGKIVIGGYGLGERVGALRLAFVALVSSLAQAGTAVLLVGAGVWLLGLGRTQMVGLTEEVFAPASYGALALIGVWLVWRGGRRMWRIGGAARAHPHHHDGVCDTCGHRHGPDPEDLAQTRGWRDVVILVGSIAIRPCTGALFLLIIAWRMEIFATGVAGAFAMGLGTASVTIAVALAAVLMRRSAALSLGQGAVARMAMPALEIAAGAAVALVAGGMMARALAGVGGLG